MKKEQYIDNFSKNKLFGLLMLFFVFVFSVFLLIDEYTLAQESFGGSYKQSESVYSFMECNESGCQPWYYDKNGNKIEAKEQFKFYGKNADCAGYYSDCEASTNCDGISASDCTMKVKNCAYAADVECRSNYSYGQAGTMEIAGSLESDGNRTYLLGADGEGNHWLKTGEDDQSKTMGINNQTSDVHFGGSLNISDSVQMQSNSEISWGNHKNSDERIDVNKDGMEFMSGDKPTMQVKGRDAKEKTVKFNNLEINSEVAPVSKVNADGSGGVTYPEGGKIHVDSHRWQGEDMKFTSGPIKSGGHDVYFYCDPSLDPVGESAGCD